MLHFCTVNLNSLFNKLHYISNLAKDEKLSLISITETWLTDSCDSSFVQLPKFSFYRGDVVGNVRKHGAGLYVSDSIKHVQVEIGLANVVVVHLIDLGIIL